jgi:DNA-binding HxlR family transcriptional regulator
MRGAAPTATRPGAGPAISPPQDAAGAADPPNPAAPLVASSRDVCPYYHEAVELLGKRWTGAIVHVLMAGPLRFSEVSQAIPQISDRLLSMRLKELESFGIIARRVWDAAPVRVEYELTPKGTALGPTVTELRRWARAWLRDEHPSPRA